MGDELRLDLTPEPASAATARRAVTAATRDWGLDSLAADVGLVASELVTNAVLHAGTDIGIQLSHRGGVVRLVVADGCDRFPTLRSEPATGLTGRGLRVVDGLAQAWGVEPDAKGKHVWCEFGDRPHDAPVVDRPDPHAEPAPAGSVVVRIEGIPILMLRESKEQVENLLRESTLALRGAAESGGTAPSRLGFLVEGLLSRFSTALAEMEDQARSARDAGHRHFTMEVALPAEAVDAGRHYLALLDQADEFSRAGRLLTPESTAQLKVFRHWYVGEILRQLSSPDATPRTFEEHLLDTVGEALDISVHAAREARVTRLSAALWGAASSAEVAEVVAEEGRLAVGASAAAVAVLGENRRVAASAESGPPVPVDEAAAEGVARTGEPVWVAELDSDVRSPFESACTVALLADDGPAGLVTFGFDRHHLFPPDEREFILLVARRAADALHRAQLLEGERRLRAVMTNARDRGEFLAEVTEVLSSSLDVAATVHGLGRLLVPRLADGCAVWLNDGRTLRSVAVAGDPLEVDENVVRDVFAAGRAAVLAAGEAGEVALLPMRARGYALGAVAVARGPRRWPLRPALTALLEETVSRGAIAIDNARLYEERSEIARTLQRNLLPPREPEVPGLDVAARYVAGAAGLDVGGDFYDVFPTGTGRYGVMIGDVCGSGAEAAGITSLARHTVRALANAAGRPHRVLSMLNDALLAADIGDRFCTVLYGALRVHHGAASLVFSSGGHPEPVVVRASGAVELVDVDGTILGAFEDPHLRDGHVELRGGDALVLYTDGVTEAHTRKVKQFGPDRLIAVAAEHRDQPAAVVATAIVDAVMTHCDGVVNDDIAVLVIRVPEGEG